MMAMSLSDKFLQGQSDMFMTNVCASVSLESVFWCIRSFFSDVLFVHVCTSFVFLLHVMTLLVGRLEVLTIERLMPAAQCCQNFTSAYCLDQCSRRYSSTCHVGMTSCCLSQSPNTSRSCSTMLRRNVATTIKPAFVSSDWDSDMPCVQGCLKRLCSTANHLPAAAT